MSYLATASLYTNPASARFTISKHRSAPSILTGNNRKDRLQRRDQLLFAATDIKSATMSPKIIVLFLCWIYVKMFFQKYPYFPVWHYQNEMKCHRNSTIDQNQSATLFCDEL